MRYYKLILSRADNGKVYVPNAAGQFDLVAPGANVSTFASHLPTNTGGLQYNPGSLNLEFTGQIIGYAQQQANPLLRVSGVGLGMIAQAANFNWGATGPSTSIVLYGGMQQGIAGPNGLANAAQAGVLIQGSVLQGFGNWQGVNQSLELIVLNGPVDPPSGISFNWLPGSQLNGVLFNALKAAFPDYQVTVSILPNMQALSPQGGCYRDLTAFAGWLKSYTQPLGVALGNPTYLGVQMVTIGNAIRVFDDLNPVNSVQLNFQDLIGQPTWIDATTVNFKTVLRADIRCGGRVRFPAGIVTPYALTNPEAAVPGAPSRSKSVFQGEFFVNTVHHFANYRQPDGDSWVSTFDATAVTQ